MPVRLYKSTLKAPNYIISINPLSPHDALKHLFTPLYTDLTFLQLGVLL